LKVQFSEQSDCKPREGLFLYLLALKAMAGHAPGAPLLTIGDLLRDLSERPSPPRPSQEDSDSPETIRAKKIAFLKSYLQPDGQLPKAKAPTLPPQPSLEGKILVEAFEKIFADLMKVMNELHDNNTWIGLTEQLSTTLTTADKLIASANKEVGPLLDKVSTLHTLVERGQAALATLQTSMSQTVHQ